MITNLIESFMMIFVVMNAFGGIPVFITLTRKMNVRQMRRAANKAIGVAAALVTLFTFLGVGLLSFFGVSLASFRIAGGAILLLVGIGFVMDIHYSKREETYQKDITIPMATPLIAGPGVLTTCIILMNEFGLGIALIAGFANLLLFWILMRYSNHIYKFTGPQGTEIISRIMGLILTAMAVEFVVTGIKAII